jgi:hypothetical protein
MDIWETEVLNTVYRESKLGLNAIHNVIGKVYDEELALDLNKQAAKYSKLEEVAATRLIENGKIPRNITAIEKARMWTNMQAKMVLNTSTEHIVEMMIKENATELTGVLKTVKRNKNISKESIEMANELMDFSEKNINILKSYRK